MSRSDPRCPQCNKQMAHEELCVTCFGKKRSMNPKDKSMICRMAGNIAGPLLAQAMACRGGNGGLNIHLTDEALDDIYNGVAASALRCALEIAAMAKEKIK